jgi:hypothetical protein
MPSTYLGISPWEWVNGLPIYPWVYTPVLDENDGIAYIRESSIYYPTAYGRGAILTDVKQKYMVRIYGGGATFENVTSSALKLSVSGGGISVDQSSFSTACTHQIASMAWRERDRLATYGDITAGGVGDPYGPGEIEVPVALTGANYYYFIINAPDATPESPVEVSFWNGTPSWPQIYIEYTGEPQPPPPEPPPDEPNYIILPVINTCRVTSIVRRAKRTFGKAEYSMTLGLGGFILKDFEEYKDVLPQPPPEPLYGQPPTNPNMRFPTDTTPDEGS